MVFFPKDPKIRSLLERLEKDGVAVTNFNTAKQFSRYKQVRQTRALKQMNIGMDRRMNESIIYSKKPIRKKGNGFLL
jgi:hypothetical protein